MKIDHLRKSEDFTSVVKKGKKARGCSITIYSGTNANNEVLTVGIIISKRSIPKAVTRNYLRRVIYSYFRDSGQRWKKGTTIVVRVSKADRGTSKKALSEKIRTDLDRLSGRGYGGKHDKTR